MSILFRRLKDQYGAFSNFSSHPVHVYGLLFKTAEHAYQAMKFSPHRADLVRRIWAAETPRQAAALGRDPGHPLHEGWGRSPDRVLSFRLPDALHSKLQPSDGLKHEEPLFNHLKDLVMYEVVYAKVTQHPDVRALLLESGDEPIVEDSTKDSYWAWGANHGGENKLGRVFMAVRSALRHGMETRTAFGKPERVDFYCTAEYPWRTEYGTGVHPGAVSTGRVGREYEGFECPHCGHYYELMMRPAV